MVMILVSLFFKAQAFAQLKDPSLPDLRASAHDTIENDPSKENLELPAAIPQKNYVAVGVGRLLMGGELKEWGQETANRYPHLLKKHADWFEVLKIHQDRYQPQAVNGPTLVNNSYEFKGISDKKFGYCWGFATLLRNFLTLAFYDSTLPPFKNITDYEAIISNIENEKPTVIPGFANLREFSLVPEIELMLKIHVMKLWEKLSIRTSSVGLYLKTAKQMDFSDELALVKVLEEKLSRGEMPKIIFSSKVAASGLVKLSKYIHAVLVNGIVRLKNGGVRIQVWDVDFYAETLAKSPKYLEINPDGTIIYEPWFQAGTPFESDSRFVTRISLTPENDRETAKHIIQLRKFCGQEENTVFCKSTQ